MMNRTDFSTVVTIATLLIASSVASACSSDDSEPLRCGPGTVKSGAQCIPEDASAGGAGTGSGGGTAGGGAGGSAGSAGGMAGNGGSGGVTTDASTDADASTPLGPPSCAGQTPGADKSCGSPAHDCCSSLLVPGGKFNRDNNVQAPATVSPFYLDEFEVTVGRFRAFVDAYPGSKPKAGDGAHPAIAGSGWDGNWDAELPSDKAALVASLKPAPTEFQVFTWTDTPGPHERRPINYVHWFLAFAFCAWDGGRLPTTAEWGFAACGGNEQRSYPWGGPFDSTRVVMGFQMQLDSGAAEVLAAIPEVGSKSLGKGRWGHLDLAGSGAEWLLDTWFSFYKVPCTDCAIVEFSAGAGDGKGIRGGHFASQDGAAEASNTKWEYGGFMAAVSRGLRCAR